MKKLTPKQRGEIYLKVAEAVFCADNEDTFLCCLLTDEYKRITRRKDYPIDYIFNLFHEFALFHPDEKEIKYPYGMARAFFKDDDEARIICMLLCYEMTKTQTT